MQGKINAINANTVAAPHEEFLFRGLELVEYACLACSHSCKVFAGYVSEHSICESKWCIVMLENSAEVCVYVSKKGRTTASPLLENSYRILLLLMGLDNS